jgi:hypothetical protein
MHTRFQQRLARLEARPRWWLGLQALVTIALALVVRALTSHDTAALLVAVNSYEVVDWLMQESLDLLVNNPRRSARRYFNTEVQKEFEHDFAPGETVRVKYPQEFLIRDGLAVHRAADQPPAHDRLVQSDLRHRLRLGLVRAGAEDGTRRRRTPKRNYLDPAMAQLAQEIEAALRELGAPDQNASTIVGVLGTDPTTFDASSAAARQKLVELGCPAGKDRGIFVPPSVMRALKNANISYFNPVSDISKMMRTGIVGYGDGFDWYESVSLYSHTAGTWAGAVTVNGAGQSGTSLTITATAGDTFKLGDKFSTANVNPTNPRTRRRVGSSAKTFTITQALTAAGGGADVLQIWPPIFGPGSQYQNVDALPANSAALTLWPGTSSPNGKSGTVSLAGMSDALALVAVEFDNPKPGSVEISKQLKDDETGITISFVRAFDPVGRRWINRFDTCLGFGNLWSDNCLVALAGA